MSFNISKNNHKQSLAEYSLTDALLRNLNEVNKDFKTKKLGFLGSFFIVHIGGSFTTLATGVCDTLFQLVVGIVKFVPGIFISLLNTLRAPCVHSKAKAYAPDWDLFASVTHLRYGVKHALSILPIFLETLCCDLHEVRLTFFKSNVLRENRLRDEAAAVKLRAAAAELKATADALKAAAAAELKAAEDALKAKEEVPAAVQTPSDPIKPNTPASPIPADTAALSTPPNRPVPPIPSEDSISPEPEVLDEPIVPQPTFEPAVPQPNSRSTPEPPEGAKPAAEPMTRGVPPACPPPFTPRPAATPSPAVVRTVDAPTSDLANLFRLGANEQRAALTVDDSELWESNIFQS